MARYITSKHDKLHNNHCGRELRTLAPAIDALLEEDYDRAFSILLGRFASVLTAARRGGD
jgi:hypothetical protein